MVKQGKVRRPSPVIQKRYAAVEIGRLVKHCEEVATRLIQGELSPNDVGYYQFGVNLRRLSGEMKAFMIAKLGGTFTNS